MGRAHLTLLLVVYLVHLVATQTPSALSPSEVLWPRRGNCSEECYQVATCNEELGGRCDCPKTLSGPDCSRPAASSRLTIFAQSPEREARAPLPCLNNCTLRGHCVQGGCVCDKGYYGSDCSTSLGADGRPVVLAGTGYKPRERGPRIYVYDIPHKYSSWYNVFKVDRGLPWVFWERLVGSGVLVADGEEADWYYIPVKLRTTSDGYHLLEAIEYVRQNWPWYDRLQGNRHFVIHTGDTGRGEVTAPVRAATENITWLHHWGLTENQAFSGWKAAHRPGKDIVVPIYFGGRQGVALVPVSGLHPRAPRLPRTQTLLFAGRICGDHSEPNPDQAWPHCATNRSHGYSQGARQLVHYYHHNRTGYKIVTKDPEYPLDLLNFKWCLAPSGGGHGHRQVLVAAMGCLPLIVSDAVMQPFEPEMDWGVFGMRVAQADVPNLHEALAAVGDAELADRQDALRCAAQHMVFSSSSGAFMQEDGRWDAFELTMEILRMQQQYPGLDPKLYAQTDARFRDFLNCGEPDMLTYGRKLRAAQHARYPPQTLPSLAPDGAPPSWQDLYGKEGLKKLVVAAQAWNAGSEQQRGRGMQADRREGAGAGEALPLCSMSMWDPEPLRCSARGFRLRSRFAFVPGGAACVEHDADISRCPRQWP